MKKVLVFVLAIVLILSVSACAEKEPESIESGSDTADRLQSSNSETSEEQKQLVVAQSTFDLKNVYYVSMTNGVRDACEEQGFEFYLSDAKSDAAQQISAIENFIVQGVDVLIVTPVDPIALEAVLQQARDAGITIINCNQEIAIKDAFLWVPDYEYGYTAGKIAADWINENLQGTAKVAVLNRPVSEPLIQRSNGFKDGVTQNSDAEIVAEQTANTAELGLKAAETILQSNPDINGFICQNDTAALGVYEALTAAGRDPASTFIVGVDGLQEAYEKIGEGGILRGTVSSNPYGMGRLAVETAIRVLQDGPVEEPISVEMIPVTIDNVADFME